jgi:hypothetical protein
MFPTPAVQKHLASFDHTRRLDSGVVINSSGGFALVVAAHA